MIILSAKSIRSSVFEPKPLHIWKEKFNGVHNIYFERKGFYHYSPEKFFDLKILNPKKLWLILCVIRLLFISYDKFYKPLQNHTYFFLPMIEVARPYLMQFENWDVIAEGMAASQSEIITLNSSLTPFLFTVRRNGVILIKSCDSIINI